MKKILLTVISALTLSATAMAQNATAIAGEYSGKLYIQIGEPLTEESEAIEGYEVELTIGENDNAINFALYDFSLEELLLGDIKLNNIGVESKGNNVYTFQKNPDVALTLAGGLIEATASLNHENSYVDGDNLVADINVMWTNAEVPTPIYVKFVGNKLANAVDNTVDVTKIVGTYSGDLFIQLGDPISDNTEALPNQKVELSAGAKKGCINLALYNFSLGELPLGDIKLENIRVIAGDANTYFFDKNPTVNLTLGEGATTIEATASLNAETSYIKDGVLTADIDVMWLNTGADPMPIFVRFVSDGVTGIENLVAAPAKKGTYTLSGVRVNSTNLPAGIYIVNGKKVLVK
jgi:hypothetical protein